MSLPDNLSICSIAGIERAAVAPAVLLCWIVETKIAIWLLTDTKEMFATLSRRAKTSANVGKSAKLISYHIVWTIVVRGTAVLPWIELLATGLNLESWIFQNGLRFKQLVCPKTDKIVTGRCRSSNSDIEEGANWNESGKSPEFLVDPKGVEGNWSDDKRPKFDNSSTAGKSQISESSLLVSLRPDAFQLRRFLYNRNKVTGILSSFWVFEQSTTHLPRIPRSCRWHKNSTFLEALSSFQ